jgi:hypothetical protein
MTWARRPPRPRLCQCKYRHIVAAFADTAIEYDGNVSSVTDSGVETTYTCNADGTVDTDTRLGVTRQYIYDGENLTGIEAV